MGGRIAPHLFCIANPADISRGSGKTFPPITRKGGESKNGTTKEPTAEKQAVVPPADGSHAGERRKQSVDTAAGREADGPPCPPPAPRRDRRAEKALPFRTPQDPFQKICIRCRPAQTIRFTPRTEPKRRRIAACRHAAFRRRPFETCPRLRRLKAAHASFSHSFSVCRRSSTGRSPVIRRPSFL